MARRGVAPGEPPPTSLLAGMGAGGPFLYPPCDRRSDRGRRGPFGQWFVSGDQRAELSSRGGEVTGGQGWGRGCKEGGEQGGGGGGGIFGVVP